MKINEKTYYQEYGKLDKNKLSENAIKMHDYINRVTKNGSDWSKFHNSENANRVIKKHFEFMELFIEDQLQSDQATNKKNVTKKKPVRSRKTTTNDDDTSITKTIEETLLESPNVRQKMPKHQQRILADEHINDIERLEKELSNIPKMYSQDGKDRNDIIVHAHYFSGQSHWFITEEDLKNKLYYGYTILNGDSWNSEPGSLSITDFLNNPKVELDFYWKKKSLAQALYNEDPDYFEEPKREIKKRSPKPKRKPTKPQKPLVDNNVEKITIKLELKNHFNLMNSKNIQKKDVPEDLLTHWDYLETFNSDLDYNIETFLADQIVQRNVQVAISKMRDFAYECDLTKSTKKENRNADFYNALYEQMATNKLSEVLAAKKTYRSFTKQERQEMFDAFKYEIDPYADEDIIDALPEDIEYLISDERINELRDKEGHKPLPIKKSNSKLQKIDKMKEFAEKRFLEFGKVEEKLPVVNFQKGEEKYSYEWVKFRLSDITIPSPTVFSEAYYNKMISKIENTLEEFKNIPLTSILEESRKEWSNWLRIVQYYLDERTSFYEQEKELEEKERIRLKQVEAFSIEVKMIKRYLNMDKKDKNRNQIRLFISALQKAIRERRITKKSKYASEITTIQKELIRMHAKFQDNFHEMKVSIIPETKEKLLPIIGREIEMPTVKFIKSYINLQGKLIPVKKAHNLHTRITRAFNAGKFTDDDKYWREIKKILANLEKFVKETKDEGVLEIESRALNGLNGILSGCGCSTTSVSKINAPLPLDIKQLTKQYLDNQKGMSGAQSFFMSSMDLDEVEFEHVGLFGRWLHLIGDPAKGARIAVYGNPKIGKSYLMIEFAGDLAKSGRKVLYVAKEEGKSATLKKKLRETNAKSPNLFVTDYIPENLSTFDFVFFDSISKCKLTPENLLAIKWASPNTVKVEIHQVNKEGKARGLNDFIHDVDSIIRLPERGVAIQEGRFEEYSELHFDVAA